jgi:uncharacterized membrane protein HdeD (DUF308 family)
MTATTFTPDHDLAGAMRGSLRYWWVFLPIGLAWLLFAVIVFRFTWNSVAAISVLFGVIVLVAAAEELLAALAPSRHGWERLAHAGLALAFTVIGVVAFIHPGDTFAALAAVMSFYFVFKGVFNIVLGLSTAGRGGVWVMTFVLGIAELGIGFWAAGDFGRRSTLLVVWVGFVALSRGISALMFAFVLRSLAHEGPESPAAGM